MTVTVIDSHEKTQGDLFSVKGGDRQSLIVLVNSISCLKILSIGISRVHQVFTKQKEGREVVGFCTEPVNNMVISGFQALRQEGRRRRDSNPRQRDPCKSQGGFASHCASEAP
ncbi:hypothetical protein PoB_003829100 [Plakobranchus ocellatus]|uniref:Uncharacterized protein n=1 Tax=Plakobranchus ocellatus TaxID=259542 RepID=A0AAV4AKU3_9GAST|nr:hypothetical protein PoB_003829100 [Plakobranchus ocellatus]